jgi:hypothetical protein
MQDSKVRADFNKYELDQDAQEVDIARQPRCIVIVVPRRRDAKFMQYHERSD